MISAILLTCISNNGAHGIHVRAEGDESHYIFTRFTNNIIWNNPLEGFRSDVTVAPGDVGANGIILTPLVQDTLAGNGDSVNASIEFAEDTATSNVSAAYSWTPPVGGNPVFATEIDNCILQRKNPTDADLGENLDTIRGTGINPSALLAGNLIGIGGTRYTISSRPNALDPLNTQIFPLALKMTTDIAPFLAGTVTWTSLIASQLFLDPSGGNIGSFQDDTPGFINLLGNEWFHDYSGDLRTGLANSSFDKGAEEL